MARSTRTEAIAKATALDQPGSKKMIMHARQTMQQTIINDQQAIFHMTRIISLVMAAICRSTHIAVSCRQALSHPMLGPETALQTPASRIAILPRQDMMTLETGLRPRVNEVV